MTSSDNTQDALSPVPLVSSVSTVPRKEGDIGDNGDTRDRGQHTFRLNSDFSVGKSEKELLAICYFNHPAGLTDAHASQQLNIERDSVKKYRQRLGDVVVAVGGDRPQRFTLNEQGRAALELEFREWCHHQAESERRVIALRQAAQGYDMRVLDLPGQLDAWGSFFDAEPYISLLLEQVRKGEHCIHVRFSDIARHSPELAEVLLGDPVETLRVGAVAIERLDLPHNSDFALPRFVIRITDLPDVKSVGTLTTKDLGHLVEIQAQVVVAGERRSQCVMARFECPGCGNIIQVVQADQRFMEPTRCTCGRKGRFKVLGKDLTDVVSVFVQQPISELAGKSVPPATLKLFLSDDLASPQVRDQLGLSSIVRVVGVLEEVPVLLKTGGTATRADWRFRVISITPVEHYNPQIRLTPERMALIKSEAQRPGFFGRLRDSVFPHHIGDDLLCQLLTVQMVAMPLHLSTSEARTQADREALHVLIMTPPGMGKSRNLAGRLLELVPIKGRANGTGATRAGLTVGADQKDPEHGLIIPSPQALPRSNLGLFVLDELDKMRIEEQPVLNDALSEHTVTVAKRGANVTLPAMVCFLGLANPRSYDWDLEIERLEQTLNIHYTLLSRCVVWVNPDTPRLERDERVGLAILQRDKPRQLPYDDDFLRDLILLARGTITPRLTTEHEQLIAHFYAKLRHVQTRKYVSPRFVEQARSLVLLHAKLHLRNETTREDLVWANEILIAQLLRVGLPNQLPQLIPNKNNDKEVAP